MIKRIFLQLIVLLTAGITLAGCAGGGKEAATSGSAVKNDNKKMVVYTTIYPLFDFARNVGGDRAEVYNLLPPGADPHHWEPTPGDIVKISKSNVFVYCGAGLESWVEGALKNADTGKMVIVDCSRGIKLLEGGGHEEGHDGHDDDEEKEKHQQGRDGGESNEDHSGTDPHIWLDPVNAAIIVDSIRDGLIKADPANKEYYTANAYKYKEKLARLDGEYRTILAKAKVKHFVVSHAAFGYLAGRYGLEQVPIRGLTADAEPNPARMAEIVALVRKYHIKYIFFETLVSPKVSETLARETGAGTLMLDPMGGMTEKDLAAGKNYLAIMEENLKNLKIACEAE